MTERQKKKKKMMKKMMMMTRGTLKRLKRLKLKRSKWVKKDQLALRGKMWQGKIMTDGGGYKDRRKAAKCVGRRQRMREEKWEWQEEDINKNKIWQSISLSLSLSLAWHTLTKTLVFLTCPLCSVVAVGCFRSNPLSILINQKLLHTKSKCSEILVSKQATSWKSTFYILV